MQVAPANTSEVTGSIALQAPGALKIGAVLRHAEHPLLPLTEGLSPSVRAPLRSYERALDGRW